MGKKDIALVLPTIRESCFNDFVERWKEVGLFDRVDLIVMEDNPTPTFEFSNEIATRHLSWLDIDEELGDKSWIIPRRSDCVRSFGYLKAWQGNYDYVMTLDDDCYPNSLEEGKAFVDGHVEALTKRSRWFNTLNDVTPRGIPYFNRGKNDMILVNHGLWTNVLDYDAPRQLVAPSPTQHSYDNRVVPTNSYFPMCGMNLAWKRDATVLMYHLLMGQMIEKGTTVPLLQKLPFDRFGDIWCGIIMKKIVDELGYNVSSGTPYIRHERASNPFTNLKKEAPGLEVNEKFWEHIDDCYFSRTCLKTAPDLVRVYKQMGQHVTEFDVFPEHKDYFQKLGQAMYIWAELFDVGNKR